jgi:molecular chaperone DnaK (HSP70)
MAGTLAIDLGSSTTVVAWQGGDGPPRLLALAPYSGGSPPVVPSLLWLSGPGEIRPLIGRQVLEADLVARGGPGLCRDFKRRIGAGGPGGAATPLAAPPARGGEESGSEGSWLTPEQAGGLLLRRLWQALPEGVAPHRLVLTAPIESYPGYRRWLQEVCRELPVAELALVDEPTAAAIGAGLPPGSRVLVVDLGGGTLDLSLVALEGGEGRAAPIAQLLRFAGRDLERSGQALRGARVIGKAGLAFGGRDLDRWIAAELCPEDPPEGALLQAAERIKCRLSDAEEALEILSLPGRPARELRLRRPALERLLRERGLLERLDEVLEAVLAGARRAGVDPAALDAVLPVGGGSRLPLLRQWLAERFPGVPLRGERPVEAVALGALALTPGVRLKDVLTRGVSLRTWDRRSRAHRWHPLFVAGQSWPTEQPLELVLACGVEGQRQLELVLGEPQPESRAEVVFENGLPVLRSRPAGEAQVRPWSAEPRLLALATPGRQGVDRLRLRFAIDAEGTLAVEGEDLEVVGPEGRFGPLPLGPVR